MEERVFLSDTTPDGYNSTDADGTNADLILQSITFNKDGEVALRVLGPDCRHQWFCSGSLAK